MKNRAGILYGIGVGPGDPDLITIKVPDIKSALDEAGNYPSCVGVKNCGHSNEEIIKDIGELSKRKPDYWTLIISKQTSQNGTKVG